MTEVTTVDTEHYHSSHAWAPERFQKWYGSGQNRGRRAEADVGIWGGVASPLSTTGGLGKRCKLSQWGK